jgi:predicted phage-related endonuclease
MTNNFAVDDQKARLQGIGGSEASAVMGDNPYLSAYELARIKTGLDEPEVVDNDFVRWGNDMEWFYRKKHRIRKPGRTYFYKDANYLYCHLDGLNAKKGIIYEIKAPTFQSPKYVVEDWRDLPKHYLWQCVHNGIVWSNSKLWKNFKNPLKIVELVIVIAPKPLVYPIPFNELFKEMGERYFERVNDFWMDCVNNKLPSPETKRDMKLAYPSVSVAEYPEASSEDVTNVKILHDLKGKKKTLEGSIELYSNLVRGSIKNFNGLSLDGEIIASNKDTKSGNRLLKTYEIKETINEF